MSPNIPPPPTSANEFTFRALDYLEDELTALGTALIGLFGPDGANEALQTLKPMIEARVVKLTRDLRDSVLVAAEPETGRTN